MSTNGESYPKIESYREIETLYEQQHLPVLREASLRAIREFFAEHSCQNIGGAIIAGDDGGSTREARSLYRHNLIDGRNNTFVGPYLMGENNESYYPNGVGVWTTGDIGSIR